MKKIYIQPQTTVFCIHLSEQLLSASDNPDVGIGDGKKSEFDTKYNDWNIWNE